MKTLKNLFLVLLTLFTVNSFSQTTINLEQVSENQEFTVPNGDEFILTSDYNYTVILENRYTSSGIETASFLGDQGETYTYQISDTIDIKVTVLGYINNIFYINVPNSTSSVDNFVNINFSVYPNPTTDFLNISGTNVESVKVFNMNGQLVLSDTYNSTDVKLDVTTLTNGFYTVFINDTKPIRFIKQ